MKQALNDAALDTLFREARSYNRWVPEPVPERKPYPRNPRLPFEEACRIV